MAPSSRPTLKTIAQLTGLAVPTVSRALSGAQDISVATRQRVRAVADEIGYVPNRAGLRLRTGRTHVLALVLHTEADVMNLTARLINAAAGALRETSYNLNVTPCFPDEDILRPVRHIVETHAADAIIMNQMQPDDPRVEYLMEKGFPFATHGRTRWAADHAYYDFDNAAFGRVAVQNLVARGCDRLYLLAPPLHLSYGQATVAGAREAAHALGHELNVVQGLTCETPGEQIDAQIAEKLGKIAPGTGLICASGNACLFVVRALERAGVTIGTDIALFAKESLPFLKVFRPSIEAQYEDGWGAGEFLARAAIERIENPDAAPMQFLEVPEGR